MAEHNPEYMDLDSSSAGSEVGIAPYTPRQARIWRHFLGLLGDKLRDLALTVIPPTVATMEWIIERLQVTENLPEEEARQEQRQLALQTNFSMLPPELFYMVLDWTFGLVDLPANPPLLCKTDFHTLHGIEDLGDEVRDRIAAWMQTQKVRNAFKNHIGAHDNF